MSLQYLTKYYHLSVVSLKTQQRKVWCFLGCSFHGWWISIHFSCHLQALISKKAVVQISIKCIGSPQRGKKLCTELPRKPANVCKWRGKSLCRMKCIRSWNCKQTELGLRCHTCFSLSFNPNVFMLHIWNTCWT